MSYAYGDFIKYRSGYNEFKALLDNKTGYKNWPDQ